MASFFLHEGPGGAHCVYADLPGNYGLCGLFRCGEGLGITAFCLTLRHTDEDGTVRTGLQGLAVYLIPDFTGLTVSRFLKILLDAMSQIEIFDTCVALLAGAMIIPAIYVFYGTEGMTSGPGLMFVSLPKVFRAMGGIGTVLGVVFFVMVALAALTSSVSIMETLVAAVWRCSAPPGKR